MQKSEENLSVPQQRIFQGQWLFDFDDHVGLCEQFVTVGDDLGPCILVFGVDNTAAQACSLLDEHLMTCLDKAVCTSRHQTDAVLILLNLPRHADDHGYPPLK